MPLYTYKCAECGREVELWRPGSEKDAPKCECGGEMARQFTLCRCFIIPQHMRAQ